MSLSGGSHSAYGAAYVLGRARTENQLACRIDKPHVVACQHITMFLALSLDNCRLCREVCQHQYT